MLGGVVTVLYASDDLNDIIKTGVYTWSGTADAPLNNYITPGSLFLVWSVGTQVFQLQWPNTYITNGLGLRIKWNGDWKDWKKIVVGSVS